MKRRKQTNIPAAPSSSRRRTIVTAGILLLLICAFLFLWAYTIAEGYFGSYIQRNEQIDAVMALNPGLSLSQAEQESLIPAQRDWDELRNSHLCDRVETVSADGTRLSGRLYNLGGDNTLLVLPQYNETSEGDFLFAPWFAEQGYNLLLADSRAHGASGGEACGFGWLEWADTEAWMAWISQWRGDGQAAVYGMGMGANAALLWAAQSPGAHPASFIIAESPYASLLQQAQYTLHQAHSVPWIPFGTAIQWKADHAGLGYTAKTAVLDPLSLDGADTPVLFLVMEEDGYIPPEYSTAAWDAYPGEKALHTFPGRHGLLYGDSREEAEQLLADWVNRFSPSSK